MVFNLETLNQEIVPALPESIAYLKDNNKAETTGFVAYDESLGLIRPKLEYHMRLHGWNIKLTSCEKKPQDKSTECREALKSLIQKTECFFSSLGRKRKIPPGGSGCWDMLKPRNGAREWS